MSEIRNDHDRIWLEAAPGADPDYGQQWCQHNVWGDDATEYVHAEIVAAKDAEIEARDKQIRILENLHKDFKTLQRRIIGSTGLSAIETIDSFLTKFDAKYLAEITMDEDQLAEALAALNQGASDGQ